MLGLFLILALAVAGAFLLFRADTDPAYQDDVMQAALRDLYIPVVAWGLLTAIDAYRQGRSGWWIYLVASPVPVVNVLLNVQWLRRWRREPKPMGRWQL